MQGFGFSAVDPYQNYDNITHNFLGVVKKHTFKREIHQG